ncbi:hypothetical protein FSP39_000244 [Pinctada imbricata]|uniref:Dehydrogenase/reductase SDR family member 11 n=1 Tax=Pinctada imbricata TaxID=66713 RepID=A0AA88XN35_PINIB|nr:hypothetical protein FSP39_000244 [Pinctada imbricata]
MEKWVGRVALVTGASAGIGAAISRKLVQHGMIVIGCAPNVEKIEEIANELESEKGRLVPVKCDVACEEEVLSMFDKAKEEFGGVDVMINNAGLSHYSPLLSGRTEDWRHMLEVNILGYCICTREAVKQMRERNVDDGHVFLVGSLSGHRMVPSGPGHFYTSTKQAIKALTDGIRNELRELKSHIRVTCLEGDDVADALVYALGAPPHVQVGVVIYCFH